MALKRRVYWLCAAAAARHTFHSLLRLRLTEPSTRPAAFYRLDPCSGKDKNKKTPATNADCGFQVSPLSEMDAARRQLQFSVQISKKSLFARLPCLTLKEPEQSASVRRGRLFFFLLFSFWKTKQKLSNKTRISVKTTRKNIHKYMFTIYYVHLHKLFKKKVDRRRGCQFKQSEESAVFTVQNVNATRRRCRFCSLIAPPLLSERRAGNTATTPALRKVH